MIPTRSPDHPIHSSIIVAMPSRASKSSKNSFRVLSSKTIFRGPIFSLVSEEVVEPQNICVRRDIIRHPGAIVVLAVDDSKGAPWVLLERQFRYAAEAFLWELPAGRIEPGENKLAAAKRELLEETGFTANKWRKALWFYPSPGFLDETMNVFLAQGLKPGKAQPEEDERIAVRFFPLQQAVQMAMSGKIIDGKSIASILWLENKLRSSR
jgi:ADP-ribose pyrophosphatase